MNFELGFEDLSKATRLKTRFGSCLTAKSLVTPRYCNTPKEPLLRNGFAEIQWTH